MSKDLQKHYRAAKITVRPTGDLQDYTERKVDDQGRVIEIHHVHDQSVQPTGYVGDEILRKFAPYFVLMLMGMIVFGGVIGLLIFLVPLIVAMVGALVSMILSLVVTVIAGVVIALGIGYLQTINGKPTGKINKRR